MNYCNYATILFLFLISPVLGNPLTIKCPHKEIPFQVELAQSPSEQAKGLMFRTYLADDAGMLFIFPRPKPTAMWMKNTFLSLDMIFCDDKGKILAIYEKTTPFSLEQLGPIEETAHVLEIKGGLVQKHEISKACTLLF